MAGMETVKASAAIQASITYASHMGMRDPTVAQLPGALRSLRGACDELLAVIEPPVDNSRPVRAHMAGNTVLDVTRPG
jgi:hypothetical protein